MVSGFQAQGKRTRLEIWTPYAASMASDAAHTRAAEDDSPDPVPRAAIRGGQGAALYTPEAHTQTEQLHAVSSSRHVLVRTDLHIPQSATVLLA